MKMIISHVIIQHVCAIQINYYISIIIRKDEELHYRLQIIVISIPNYKH